MTGRLKDQAWIFDFIAKSFIYTNQYAKYRSTFISFRLDSFLRDWWDARIPSCGESYTKSILDMCLCISVFLEYYEQLLS